MEESGGNSSLRCDYQDYKYRMVAVVAACVGTFSLLASLFVIGITIIFRKYNFFIQRLVLYLSIAAALNSVAVVLRFSMLDRSSNTEFLLYLCKISAFIDQTTLWSLNIAFCCLTFSMLVVVLFNRTTHGLELAYVFFIFLFPIMFNWIPFLKGLYGPAGAWCWIKSYDYEVDTDGSLVNCTRNPMGFYMQYILWYVPHDALLLVLLVVYLIVVSFVICRRYQQWRGLYREVESNSDRVKNFVLPIIFYPLGFFILNMFPFINRLYDNLHGPNLVLWVLHAAMSPLQGGYIALVYVLDRDTLKRLNPREIHAYLLRRTQISEYPVRGGLADSYDDSSYLVVSKEKETEVVVSKEKETEEGLNPVKKTVYGSIET